MKYWAEFPTDDSRRNVYVNLSNVRCVLPKHNDPTATLFYFQDTNYYITVDMSYNEVIDKIKHLI